MGLPSGWSESALDSAAECYSGGTPSRKNREFYGGSIPWVKSGEVNRVFVTSTDETITEAGLAHSSARWVPRGSVLIAMYGATAGKIARLEIDATINQAIQAVVARPKYATNEFLFYALQAAAPSLLYHVQGSGQPNLSGKLVKSLKLRLPTLGEQKKIAAILGSVDEAIQATQAVIDQTRKVKQGLLQQLLTRGIGHTRFKQTEIGQIPESWVVKPLHEVCSRVGVGIASSATHAYADAGVPMLRNQNIKEGWIDSNDLLFVTPEYDERNRTKRIRTGDVVTVRTGYPGVSAVVPPQFDGCQTFTTLISRPNVSLLEPEFLAAWVNSDYGKSFALSRQAGGAQKNLNVGVFRDLPVPLPTPDEQLRIIKRVRIERETEVAQVAALGSATRLKTGLMSDLLSGRVRVKVNS